MKYNELILYNQNHITYNGSLLLKINGITNPVRVNDIQIIITNYEDLSNFTSAGIIQIDVIPTSELTFILTDVQASAIVDVSNIAISLTAEAHTKLVEAISSPEAGITSISNSNNSEMSVINISTEGTLLIPNS